jgi:hypothetical protein
MLAGPSVESLLRAWAAWSAADCDGLDWAPTCGSAERAWRPPAGSVWEPDRRARPVILPDEVGLAVDAAVTRLPVQMRAVICAYYLRGRAPLRRDVAILQAAVQAIGEALEQPRQRPGIAPGAAHASAPLGG